jgi:hypothetical protein
MCKAENMAFKSNTELFEAIERLSKDLASTGQEDASSLIAKGMSGLNGLTDGWAYLLDHLDLVKKQYDSCLSTQQSEVLSHIQLTVYKVVHRE